MNIRANVGGRDFGGYNCGDYTLVLSHDGRDPCEREDYVEALSAILLNQKSPISIDGVVRKGKQLDEATARAVAENLEPHYFERQSTQLGREIAALNRRRTRECLLEGQLAIKVSIKYNGHHRQRSGSLTINGEVAEWLGMQLIALACGYSKEAKLNVTDDHKISIT